MKHICPVSLRKEASRLSAIKLVSRTLERMSVICMLVMLWSRESLDLLPWEHCIFLNFHVLDSVPALCLLLCPK
jgi:hypothetical protein